MTTTLRVLRYEASNVLRGKGVIAWGLLFIAIGEALLRFGGDDSRALLSLVNIVLFVVPLVSLVFGAMYLYGAREFNEMLLAQPVPGRGRTTGRVRRSWHRRAVPVPWRHR
jgi:Cu-processing system permease protein